MDLFHWILVKLIGYNNSLLDNRFMYHVAGGYMVSHISSLFLKRYYVISPIIGIIKELVDHFIFGCGGNEKKHFVDLLGWVLSFPLYYLIIYIKK